MWLSLALPTVAGRDRIRFSHLRWGDFHPQHARNLKRESSNPPSLTCSVNPSEHQGSMGILTHCPSATPFGLTLGSTYLRRTNLAPETLINRLKRFSLSFVTHAGILTCIESTCALAQASIPIQHLSTMFDILCLIQKFGIKLSPVVLAAPKN